jgi:VCBS repeat-containing protein
MPAPRPNRRISFPITMTEDSSPVDFDVRANDVLDTDLNATNALSINSVTVTGPAGETFANTDATATIVTVLGTPQIHLALTTASFQQLTSAEHATVVVSYKLTGDPADTSDSTLTVQVNGVNDVPVAVDDTGTMTEDASPGTFTVLTGPGADTLDADHGAPNNVTYDAGTHPLTIVSAPPTDGIDAADVGVTVNGSNQLVVTLGSDFQHLGDGESASIDIPYTLHGNGTDASTATLHLTVTGVNDAPSAADFTFNGTNSAIGNTSFVLDNQSGPSPTDPAGPQKTVIGSLLTGATDADGPATLVTVAEDKNTTHGHVTINTDGDFTYLPNAGYIGDDTFTYQVSDQNGGITGPGIDTGNVTITIAAPTVWYVNAGAGTDGDGTSDNPFNTLSHFSSGGGNVDHAGDTIFLYNTATHYTGGLTLENNEKLIGQTQGLTVNGTTLEAATGSTNPIIDGGVVLGTGDTIDGVDLGTNSGFALSGNSVTTATFAHGAVNNTTGGGVGITGTGNALTMDFTSFTSSGGTNGVALSNATGTFHAHSGGTIGGASGADVSLSGGTVNFTLDGAINDATGTTVSVSGMTGGTQDFNGAITGGAISLATNTGATMSFDGGLNLSTGAANAFSATGGGTVVVTDSDGTGTGVMNKLATTTGTALNVTGTTIGGSGLTFHDISSNGAASGIILNTTGASGLTVQGDGGGASNHSGGIINASTGAGVSLTSAANVNLGYLDITNSGADGISGTTVNGLVVNRTNIRDVNTAGSVNGTTNDNGIELTNASGTVTVSNSLIDQAPHNGIFLTNTSTNMTALNVTGTTISNMPNTSTSNNGILVVAAGTSTIGGISVSGSTFSNIFATGIQVDTNDTATNSNIVVQNNTFTNDNIAANFTQNGSANVNLRMLTNSISGMASDSINLATAQASTGGTVNARIDGNTIGTNGVFDSGGGQGIRININGQAHANIALDNNVLDEIPNGRAIEVIGRLGSGGVDATIVGNTVNAPAGTQFDLGAGPGVMLPLASIYVEANSGNTVRTDIHGNTAYDPGNTALFPAGGEFAYYLHEGATAGGGNIQLVGSAATPTIQINNTNTVTNPRGGSSTNAIHVDAGVTLIPGPISTPPLLAAQGGIAAADPSAVLPGVENHLTMTELTPIVQAALGRWAAAGLSAEQMAVLHHVTFDVADLSTLYVGSSTAGHVTLDLDAAGNGWFVDPTPGDDTEFGHAAGSTHLVTDPTEAPAGHMDLLTTVMHEMGHQIGLDDLYSAQDSGDLMYGYLVTGERRLPGAGDVAQTAENALPPDAAASEGTPLVAGGAGNDALNAGHGGMVLVGGAGADTFVFDQLPQATAAPAPVAHIADYSAIQGDTIDLSALMSGTQGMKATEGMLVRAHEDASDSFATVQVNTAAAQGGAHWVDVAQLDGVHAGDAISVILDAANAQSASMLPGIAVTGSPADDIHVIYSLAAAASVTSAIEAATTSDVTLPATSAAAQSADAQSAPPHLGPATAPFDAHATPPVLAGWLV